NQSVSAPGENGLPALTLQQVSNAWENVKKRIKQKNKQTAALLNYYTAVGVEGTTEQPVVIIQAANETFYKHMQQVDRTKYVEWALNVEFGKKCRVQLVISGQSV